jgi:hypothetical protein
MALKQYNPGTTFPGRMGRTIGESEPGLAGAAAGERRRPQCFVHDARHDTGFGSELGRTAQDRQQKLVNCNT